MAAKKTNKKAQGAGDVKAQMLAALEAKNNRAKDVPHDSATAKPKVTHLIAARPPSQ